MLPTTRRWLALPCAKGLKQTQGERDSLARPSCAEWPRACDPLPFTSVAHNRTLLCAHSSSLGANALRPPRESLCTMQTSCPCRGRSMRPSLGQQRRSRERILRNQQQGVPGAPRSLRFTEAPRIDERRGVSVFWRWIAAETSLFCRAGSPRRLGFFWRQRWRRAAADSCDLVLHLHRRWRRRYRITCTAAGRGHPNAGLLGKLMTTRSLADLSAACDPEKGLPQLRNWGPKPVSALV